MKKNAAVRGWLFSKKRMVVRIVELIGRAVVEVRVAFLAATIVLFAGDG